MSKKHIVIISPALANANNGNWQTAWRWSRFLSNTYQVTLAAQWGGAPCDAMIALHARRSAESIAAFSAACPLRPLIVVLTGTDLYKDILTNLAAQHSLQIATQLVGCLTGGSWTGVSAAGSSCNITQVLDMLSIENAVNIDAATRTEGCSDTWQSQLRLIGH